MMFHLVKQQHQEKVLYDEVLGSPVPFSLAIFFFSVTVNRDISIQILQS
jgi:hypothetical protein